MTGMATPEMLAGLHGSVCTELIETLKRNRKGPVSAPLLTVCRQYLADQPCVTERLLTAPEVAQMEVLRGMYVARLTEAAMAPTPPLLVLIEVRKLIEMFSSSTPAVPMGPVEGAEMPFRLP